MLPGKVYTPDEVLRILWRRRWLLLVPLALAGGAAAIYSRTLPDRFRSETLILVVPQRVPESYVRSTVTGRRKSVVLLVPTAYMPRSATAAQAPALATPSTAMA